MARLAEDVGNLGGDKRTRPTPCAKIAFGRQLVICQRDGHARDIQQLRQLAAGGKAFARSQPSRQHHLPNGVVDLALQGDAVSTVQENGQLHVD
jgi:hypothetical protein